METGKIYWINEITTNLHKYEKETYCTFHNKVFSLDDKGVVTIEFINSVDNNENK